MAEEREMCGWCLGVGSICGIVRFFSPLQSRGDDIEIKSLDEL